MGDQRVIRPFELIFFLSMFFGVIPLFSMFQKLYLYEAGRVTNVEKINVENITVKNIYVEKINVENRKIVGMLETGR
jgi:hypothetical protein